MSERNGDLPEGWAIAKADELRQHDAPIIYGILQPGPEQEEGVYYVRPTEIVNDVIQVADLRKTTPAIAEKYKRSSLKSGDTLLSIVGTIGKVAAVPPKLEGANITQSSVRIRTNGECVEAAFIRHALKAPPITQQYDKYRLGTGVPRLNVAHVRELDVPLAPLAEQRRIVAKIEAMQERSRKARELLAEVGPLLEQFRRSLLAAAFRGDLTADWRAANPITEPATTLLARIRQERRQKWEQAELAKYEAKGKQPPKGWQDKYDAIKKKAVRATVADVRADGVAIGEIPEGWELVRLGDIANLQAGYAFKSKWFTKTGVRLLRGTNIEPGNTRWTDTVHLPTDQSNEYGEYLLNEGDVVIAMDRPVISTGLKVTRISETDLPALLLQRVGRFQIEDRITPEFIYQFVQSPFFMRHIGVQATGTQLPHISANDIESAILPLPPLEEQAAIVESVSRSLEAIDEVETVLAKSESALTQLEQSILAKAFRGELVPQDPKDEPASALLERIREMRDKQKQ